MIILTIRTDKPEAEIGLYNGTMQLAYKQWVAHRQLAETLLLQIEQLLTAQQKDWHDIGGIACYQGPGSFTGLRIGLTIINTLSYSLGIPIVGCQSDDWIAIALARLEAAENDYQIKPLYGTEVHITLAKK